MIDSTWLIILYLIFAIFLIYQIKKNISLEDSNNNLNSEVKRAEKNAAKLGSNISVLEKIISDLKNDQVKKEKELLSLVNNEKKELLKIIEDQRALIERLEKQLIELERKISIFTEIGADSKELNTIANEEQNDKIIDEILQTVTPTKYDLEQASPSNYPSSATQSLRKKGDLDDEQKTAFLQMENTNNNFFITGRAGTGKSFLLRMFEKGTKKKVLKLAPTGVSALNVGGATLHSVFGFNNLENLSVDEIDESTITMSSQKSLVLREVDTIIIDEISMVRADTFDKIDKILKITNNSSKLFGGKQILIFGDVFQLPPIASSSEEKCLREKYESIFFFDSDAYRNGGFIFVELKTNHRQEGDSDYFSILNHIREGIFTTKDFQMINSRVVKNSDELRRIVRLYSKRQDADRVNNEELKKIPAKEYSFLAKVETNKYGNPNIMVETYFQAATLLKLKKGALVMLTKNDPNKRWVNGTLGIVSNINDNGVYVTINDIEYEIKQECFELREAIYRDSKIKYDVVLSVVQYPLMLAYAITIHKSQGSTYKRIVCDPHDCFASGQAYVALSRCESLKGLHLLEPLTSDKVKVDNHVKSFYSHHSGLV